MYFMDSIIKRFVFTVGPPGSGKSTQFPDAYEADKYPNLYSRSGHINKRLLKLAHTKCLEDCIKDMTQGTQLVVQSNTNLNSKNLISYLEACVRYNYQVNCILPINDLLHFHDGNLKTRSNQIKHLIETRSRGIRIIPEDVIYRMVNDFDDIMSFYQKLVDEKRPEKWIEAIKNPFFDYYTFPISKTDITSETINKIKVDEDITLYTPVMDSLKIITDTEDETIKFRTDKIVQLKNRRLAYLTLTSHHNKGFIILWNEGYDLEEVIYFIKN